MSSYEIDDILRPLNDEEYSELLELYREKYKSNGFQYLLLFTHYQWNEQLQELNINKECKSWISFRKVFYTHRNGNFRKYGTYICLHQDLIQSVAFHTWEPNANELLDCLNGTSLILWKNGPLLISVANEYTEAIKNIALSKGITIQRARQCQGFILNNKEALQLEIPNLPIGYETIQLQERDTELVHSLWANNKEASINYIKGFIYLKKCIGIADKETGNLVGWIFQNEFSGLGILQVLPSAQRKGLGKYLAISMTKLIAETANINPSAWAVMENVKSSSLLQKIGYKRHVINEWIQTSKKP